jgi:hypothetical protein
VPEYALAVLAILHRLSYLIRDFIELNDFVIDGFRMFNIVHPPNLNQCCSEIKNLNFEFRSQIECSLLGSNVLVALIVP